LDLQICGIKEIEVAVPERFVGGLLPFQSIQFSIMHHGLRAGDSDIKRKRALCPVLGRSFSGHQTKVQQQWKPSDEGQIDSKITVPAVQGIVQRRLGYGDSSGMKPLCLNLVHFLRTRVCFACAISVTNEFALHAFFRLQLW
jgi:hypothetical protein